ncbi:hypothetical protein BH23BAC3_BH23BAC3_08860 [soil metagenome]
MDFRIISSSVLFLILISGCSKKEHTFFDSEINYQSAAVQYEILFDEILMPRKMRVIDQMLLVSDFSNQPPFHVLDVEDDGSLRYIKGVGREGEQTGEFMMIEDFIDADSLIYIFDSQQHKLVAFNRELNFIPEEEIHLRGQGRPLTMYGLSDGKFATIGLFSGERFQLYNRDGEIAGRHGELVSFDNSFSGRELAVSWYSFSAIHHDEDIIYLFSSNSDYIEKYRVGNGELLKTVKGNQHPYPRMNLEMVEGQTWPVDDGSIYSYLWADSDDRQIYALYSGEMQSGLERFQADKIHILDWDLNLVAAYELDHFPFTMAADGRGGIYTVTHTGEGTVFRNIKFDLSM